MYIGVWPELHLAKLVAAAQASQEEAQICDDEGQYPVANTPSSIASGAASSKVSGSGDNIWQVPWCRRVDLVGDDDAVRSARRQLEIGPADLSAACRIKSESKRKMEKGALPSVARQSSLPGRTNSSSSTPPNRLLRNSSANMANNRAHSQPRSWQLEFQHDQVPAASTPSQAAAQPPRVPRPHALSGSSPPTPPVGSGSPNRPPVPRSSRPSSARSAHTRTPPFRLPSMHAPRADKGAEDHAGDRRATSKVIGSAKRASSADNPIGATHQPDAPSAIPSQPVLSSTPPWVQSNTEQTAASSSRPAWLRDIRTSVEITRGLFKVEAHGHEHDSSPSPLRSKRLTSALENASSCNALPIANAKLKQDMPDMNTSPVKCERADCGHISDVVNAHNEEADAGIPQGLQDANEPHLFGRNAVPTAMPVRSPAFEEDFSLDPADEELIAWSQALRIDDLADNDVLAALSDL